MIYYMVGKLVPNSTHFTRGLVKYVPGRGYFRTVPSQNGDKFVTSPHPQSLNDSGRVAYLRDVPWHHPEVSRITPIRAAPTEPPRDIYAPMPKSVSVAAPSPAPVATSMPNSSAPIPPRISRKLEPYMDVLTPARAKGVLRQCLGPLVVFSIKVISYALGCMRDFFYYCWLFDCCTALLPIALHSAPQIPLQLPEILGRKKFI